MEIKGDRDRLEKDESWHGSTTSEAVPSETAISLTFSSRSRKGQVTVLVLASLSLFEPLRNCTDTELEVKLKKGKVWRCLLRVASLFCNISEPRAMSLS